MSGLGSSRLFGLEDASCIWRDGGQGVSEIALDYFQNICTSEGLTNVESVFGCVDQLISTRMNRLLTRPISFNEVMSAVFDMAPSKAPSPDSMGAGFF